MKHFILASLMILSFSAVKADDKKKSAVQTPIEINRVGVFNNQPVYSICNISASNLPLLVVIKDEFGEVLYEQLLSPQKMSFQLQFNFLELGNMAIIFEAYSSNGILQHSSKLIPETL
jgi:hypothetical protein